MSLTGNWFYRLRGQRVDEPRGRDDADRQGEQQGGEPDQPDEGGHGPARRRHARRSRRRRREGERTQAQERQNLLLLRESQNQRVLSAR